MSTHNNVEIARENISYVKKRLFRSRSTIIKKISQTVRFNFKNFLSIKIINNKKVSRKIVQQAFEGIKPPDFFFFFLFGELKRDDYFSPVDLLLIFDFQPNREHRNSPSAHYPLNSHHLMSRASGQVTLNTQVPPYSDIYSLNHGFVHGNHHVCVLPYRRRRLWGQGNPIRLTTRVGIGLFNGNFGNVSGTRKIGFITL